MFGALPICRVCLKTSLEYIDFDTPFEVESSKEVENDLTYLDCFLACTRLEVEVNENCPQSLCSSCGMELKIAYEFLQKAETADRALREFAANTKLEKPDEEQQENASIQLDDHNELYDFGNGDICRQDEVNAADNETYEQIENQVEEEKSFVCTICGEQFFSQFVLNLHVKRSHCNEHIDAAKTSVEKVECQICEVVIPLAKLNSHMQLHDEANSLDFESGSNFAASNNDEQLIDVGADAEFELLEMTGESITDASPKGESQEDEEEEEEEDDPGEAEEYEPNPDDEEKDDDMELKIEPDYPVDHKFSLIEKILTDQEKMRVTKPNYKRCNICHRHVRTVSFEAHMNVHNDIRQFACEHCPGEFFSKRSLQKHIKTAHNDQLKSVCRICHETVEGVDMKTHIQEKHLRTVKCSHCDYQGQELKMKEHMKRRHAESRDFLCNVCSKVFSTMRSLKSHMRYHASDNNKSDTCDVCGKSFASKHCLRVHLTTHDTNRQAYPCDVCDKTYYSKAALSSHKRYHKGDTIKCVQCPKEFIHQVEYKIHLRFHTNEYPFQCDRCGQKFATKGHMNSHIKKHLGWKLKCEHCGKLFAARKGYTDHLFKHSVMPYPCPHCKKVYPTKSKLKFHLKTTHSLDVPLEELSKLCVIEPEKKIRTKLEWIQIDEEQTLL